MSAKLVTGQVTLSGVAQPLATAAAVNHDLRSFVLKNPVGNPGTLYFGDATVTTGTGYSLSPGESFNFEYANESGQVIFDLTPADVYVVGASGVACWVQAGR